MELLVESNLDRLKQSRRWKIVTLLYSAIAAVLTAMTFITTWTPAELLGSWSGKCELAVGPPNDK
ncbi:MAG TPA: hypothetical protein DC054_00680 [Blastocatellia bacterium]|nr:hypothetical protein [Blastocatellia bacterium]